MSPCPSISVCFVRMHDQCELDKRFPTPRKIHVDVKKFEEHMRRSLPVSTKDEFYEVTFCESKFYDEWKLANPGKTIKRTLFLENLCDCLMKPNIGQCSDHI